MRKGTITFLTDTFSSFLTHHGFCPFTSHCVSFVCHFYADKKKKKTKPPVKSGLPAGEVFGIRVTLHTSDISKIKSLDPYPTESETVVSVSTTLCLGGLLS